MRVPTPAIHRLLEYWMRESTSSAEWDLHPQDLVTIVTNRHTKLTIGSRESSSERRSACRWFRLHRQVPVPALRLHVSGLVRLGQLSESSSRFVRSVRKGTVLAGVMSAFCSRFADEVGELKKSDCGLATARFVP